MEATSVTLNDLEGHSAVAGLLKCNPSNICAPFCTISTDSVLARYLCISRACVANWTYCDTRYSYNIWLVGWLVGHAGDL